MKAVTNVLFYLVSGIISILSFAMMLIELRLLICGDFIIYDNAVNGFIRYFFRFLLSFGFLFMTLCEFSKKFKNKKIINNNLLVYEMSLLIASVIIFFSTTNYINVICVLLMIAFISLKILKIQICEKK